VDVRRFSRVRALPARPRRALLYGHGGFSTEELQRLESVCSTFGLTLDKIGYPYGNPNPAPESFLPDYDIVFAIGRCAIESIACGCAVIPIVHGLAGSLVTEDTLANWAYSNFSPRHFTSGDQADETWFATQLDSYDPATQARTTEAVRTLHSLDRAVDALDALYREAADTPTDDDGGGAFASYLERLSLQGDDLWVDLQRLLDTDRREAQMRDALVDAQQFRLQKAERECARLLNDIEALGIQLSAFDRLVKGLIRSIVVPAPAQPHGQQERMTELLAKLLQSSGVFDMSWYLSAYPDVAAAGVDPVAHYIHNGAKEGRYPSPFVETRAELNRR
jgi:hypothetical protein